VAQPGIKELLEAGVHFGHQTRRWNPKMRRFLHGERDGIYIIDLLKTKRLLDQASEFAGTVAHRGGAVLFVGTKKQARDAVREVAEATGMPYVNHRWLGGLLTNFQTMSERIRRLHDLERYETEGQLALLPTRERLSAQADLAKLRANLGGVKNMKGTPAAIFVIDLKTEAIAVREAQRLRIPIIGLVDTNCDPDGIDFVIPGNDDAIRSCAVIARAIGERVGEGAGVYRAEQERLRAEAEERARREAEERAKREAEQAELAAQAAAAAQEAEAAAAAARAAAAVSAPAAAEAPTPAAQPQAAPEQAAPEQAAAERVAETPAPAAEEPAAADAPTEPAAAAEAAPEAEPAPEAEAAPEAPAEVAGEPQAAADTPDAEQAPEAAPTASEAAEPEPPAEAPEAQAEAEASAGAPNV
jgi:small subunit ribosomal protein S2